MLVKTLLPFIVAALAVNAAPLADAGKAPAKGHEQAPAPAPALPAKLPVEPRKEVSKTKAGKKTDGSSSPLPVDPAAKLAAAKGNVPRDEDDDEEYDDEESEASAAKPKHKEPTSPVAMLPSPAKQIVKMAPRAEDRVAKLKESQPDFRPTTHTTDAQSKKVSKTSSGTMMVYDVGHEKGTEAVQPLGVHVRDSSEPQLPKPVNAFPRDSKPAKKPVQDMPQAPPAQVVGAKDEVLSHAPRDSKKTTPQMPPAQVVGAKDDVLSHAPRDSKAAAPQLPPAQVVGAKDEVLSHAPRDSKKTTPQVPPAQVVGAKDEVLSHSPRDSKKAPQVPPAQVMGAKDDVFSHAPRDSKAAQPQVPPAQVVGAKDEVLSHAPRAHDKNQKQTPLSTVQGAVEEKPKMVTGSAM